jgi:putative DNA primase/helicase
MQLTRPRQLQLIANWFHGIPAEREYHPADFDDDLAYAWREMQRSSQPTDAGSEEAAHILDAVYKHMKEMLRQPEPSFEEIRLTIYPANHAQYLSLAELAETLLPITWLWPGWLPIGMISMLAARAGTGKSLVALDLCRRIIAGEDWPDGSPQTRPGANCIYVDAENVPAILNQRAVEWEKWGMDRRRIYPLIPEQTHDIVNLGDDHYRDLLWNMAFKIKPALIIIDSLRDILPAGESAVEDVRTTLAFLSNLAVQNSAAVLIVHHLRKGQNSGQLALMDSIDLDQVSGSGYIGGRARVIMGLIRVQTGPKPDKNGPRKIEVIKTNLGEYPDDLGITFEKVPPDGLKLTWTENAPEHYQEPTERDSASEWLLQYLADAGEPVNVKQVIEAAADAGFGRATIYRARDELKGEIINSKGRKHPDNGWMLASLDTPEDADTG